MTKREIVLDSFGEFKEYIERYVDENGWLEREKHSAFIRNHFYLTDNLETKFVDKIEFWRPKSLSGIENNNGWTIFSENNELPEECSSCFVVINGKITEASYVINDRWFVKGNDYPETTDFHGITHWQLKTKPKPPIY